MTDKPPAQIINLFEALKDTLHANSRSVGDVPAPCDHSHLDHTRPGNYCVACGGEVPSLAAQLATSVERNATLAMFDKAIAAHAGPHPHLHWIRVALTELRRVIEKGEHVK
jgi:hypothetical protein